MKFDLKDLCKKHLELISHDPQWQVHPCTPRVHSPMKVAVARITHMIQSKSKQHQAVTARIKQMSTLRVHSIFAAGHKARTSYLD